MKSIFKNATIWLFAAALVSCSSPPEHKKHPVNWNEISRSNLDSTISPGDDFFRHVNAKWLSRTNIPADRGAWGAFTELREHNQGVVRGILNKSLDGNEYLEGTNERKVVDFYRVGIDSLLAEHIGVSVLNPALARIDGLTNRLDIQAFLVEDDAANGDAFFKLDVSPDEQNSDRMMIHIGSGGIGLPERDYYFKNDNKSIEIRQHYRDHVVRMLILSGWDEAKAKKGVERILQIESALAAATMTKEERRDPLRQYNKMAVSELSMLAPSINWKAYFSGLKINEDSIVVQEPAFIRSYERIGSMFPVEDIRSYLRWTLVRKAAPFLNHAFVTESFEFNEKFLLGAEGLRPRWARVLETMDMFLGEAVGKLYVAEVFPPRARMKVEEMVENIKFAFADRIKQIDWMSDSTKKKALQKLSAITVKIGYPDRWRNDNMLFVSSAKNKGSYYGNVLLAAGYLVQEKINRLGKPVDRSLWGMVPQAVNACYNPKFNEILFPAGILQPPFYDYRADDAVNYGGIGAVIGHEISHCFDDEGSRYDARGNLKNWWTDQDFKKSITKGNSLAEQFNLYQPLPGLFVQGQFCLGENMGDLGGLSVSLDGLNRSFQEANAKPSVVNGLSPEQRFFISWATIWRTKYRDGFLRNQVLTNEHAPAMYRANGPVSNMPEFYKAFDIKPGDKMYRQEKDRIRIW